MPVALAPFDWGRAAEGRPVGETTIVRDVAADHGHHEGPRPADRHLLLFEFRLGHLGQYNHQHLVGQLLRLQHQKFG